jgi:adenylosuccinate synthase
MNLVVIGAQWGDEGKGKMVDYLAAEADVIIRYSGGANAGHTVIFGGQKYALHLMPSGVFYPDKTVVLGSGVVIDPEQLIGEVEMLEERGINIRGRFWVSDRAHIVLPSYKRVDQERDAARARPIGTTGRGIGIAYALKSERDGIRIADLDWQDKLDGLEDGDRLFLDKYRDALKGASVNMAAFIHHYTVEKKRVLFEGAQGAMLDLDSGTYPYVTSGQTAAGGASMGAAIGPRKIDKVLGVMKAYNTRVGNGPFPTEFNDKEEGGLANFIREQGHEYGTTTGRARRCGYLDLPALRYACQVNSIDGLMLTHLDIYDTLAEIKVCTAYNYNGAHLHDFPSSVKALQELKPVYQTLPGWEKSTSDVRQYEHLPQHARDYIKFIEGYCETPVSILSVGVDRAQTIVRQSAWE